MTESAGRSGAGQTGNPNMNVTLAVIQVLREQLAQRDADMAALRTALDEFRGVEARWREREAGLEAEIGRLRAEAEAARAMREDAEADWRRELALREQQWQESLEAQLAPLRAALEQSQAEAARLRAEAAEVRGQHERFRATHTLSLSAVRGIGPKLEADLRAVGIETCAELAQRTPEELQRLLNPPKWRKLDFESWIAQAAVLAKNEAS